MFLQPIEKEEDMAKHFIYFCELIRREFIADTSYL